MTLDQLYYFRKLAELQHFTKASSELYISQPSLSLSIKNLEKELGVALFQKRGRNVILTDYGEEFLMYVDEVLTKLDEGVAAIKRHVDSKSDKIRIGALPIFPGNFITVHIRTFMETFPQATFDVITCNENKDIINGIIDGIYDLGFCYKIEEEKDLVFTPIVRLELVVLVKAGHELSQKSRLTLSDLKTYPLITYRESNPLGNYIRTLFKENKITPNIVFSFDESITISAIVAQDLGVAVLANIPIQPSDISIIPLDLNTDSPVLYFAYYKNSYHTKALQKFIRLLNASSAISG